MTGSEIASLLAAIVSAAATVVLALLTARYVRLSHEMLVETRKGREPGLFVDIQFVNGIEVHFVIGNRGSSAAKSISFQFDDRIPWTAGRAHDGFSSIDAIKNGIEYLAPDRELKFFIGLTRWEEVARRGGGVIVQATYHGEDGREYQHRASFDLRRFGRMSLDSMDKHVERIADGVSKLAAEADRRTWSSQRVFGPRLKQCPECGEQIRESAKKCPRCHERIDQAEEKPKS